MITERECIIKNVLSVFKETSRLRELESAVRGALMAAHICEAVATHHAMTICTKTDLTPVTIADYASQYLICKEILSALPDARFVAEENLAGLDETQIVALESFIPNIRNGLEEIVLRGPKAGEGGSFWTIDPIDGTKGYIRGDQYCVCIALAEQNQVGLAVLACPRLHAADESMGCLFVAIRDFGSYEFPLANSNSYKKLPYFPDRAYSLSGGRLVEGFEAKHQDHSFSSMFIKGLRLHPDPIRMDSQCKYGLVARGEASIYLRKAFIKGYEEKIWDHASGNLIVEEAGGGVTDYFGKKISFDSSGILQLHGGILATNFINSEAHLQALDIIKNIS